MRHLTVMGFCLLVFNACDNSTTEAPDDKGLIQSSQYDAFTITVTGADEITLTHSLGDTLQSRDIQTIQLGYLGSSGYQALESAEVVSTTGDGRRSFRVGFVSKLDSSWISPTLVLRYVLSDSTSLDFARTVDLYRYPYQYTNLVAIMDRAQFVRGPQDVVWWADSLYMHTLGQVGLFSWHPSAGWHKLMNGYGSADHIAADSGYLFLEASTAILRYNIILGEVQDYFSIPGNSFVFGMDTYEGHLYTLQEGYIKKYTYSGDIVDSTEFHWNGFYMTIADGTLFVANGYNRLVRRYDLSTLTELESFRAPLSNGIKYHADSMYFCDGWKYAIFSVALTDMRALD